MTTVLIDVQKLPPEGGVLEGALPAGELEIPAELARLVQPIRYRLDVHLVSGGLLVTGRVGCTLEMACSRCGEFFSTIIESSGFLRDYPLAAGQVEVDVAPDLREEMLLQVPGFPVCSEQCAGLCAACGANLNRGPCACPKDRPGDGPWSELGKLKL